MRFPLRKRLVAPGIHDVDSGPQDRDGRAASFQSAAVRCAVHAQSKAAHDGESGLAQGAGEALRVLHSLGRGVSAADHCESRGGKKLHVAGDIEQGRRVRDFQELLGVFGIGEREQRVPGLSRPLERFFDFRAAAALEDARRKRLGYHSTELRSRGAQYSGRQTEGRKQGPESLVTESGDEA